VPVFSAPFFYLMDDWHSAKPIVAFQAKTGAVFLKMPAASIDFRIEPAVCLNCDYKKKTPSGVFFEQQRLN
jgi:hypothetical protein